MEKTTKTVMNFTAEQQAAIDFPGHCLVTANAGSGKTQVFSTRFVNTAMKEKDARKIVAITFTDKAASELYNKIAKEIDTRIDNKDTKEWERDLLYRLRRQLISAQISTIHSFCSGILKRFPVKAGLDANFTPIDQRVSKELIEKSIEETIKESLSPEDPIGQNDNVKYLIRFFGSKQSLSDEITRLINNRTDVFDLEEIYSAPIQDIAQGFADKFDTLARDLFSPEDITRLYHNLCLINETVMDRIKGEKKEKDKEKPLANHKLVQEVLNLFPDGIASIDGLFSFIRELDKKELLTKGERTLISVGYANKYVKDNAGTNIAEFNAFIKSALAFPFPDNRKDVELKLAGFGKILFAFFKTCNERYERKKKDNGFVDFEDILLKTRRIIVDEEVYSALRKEYSYIMIDEYQDTNELQYHLFLPVLDRLNHGNLFVVGDEKQSIYMFRNADLKVFNRTKDDIIKTGGEKKVLPHSFRMAAPNCLFTNDLFETLFEKHSTDPESLREKYNEVNNTPLKCGVGKDPVGKIEILLSDKSDLSNREADMVARKILLLLGKESFLIPGKNANKEPEHLDFRHMAVLCRKRKSFSSLEKAFVNYNIPYCIVGGQGFYQKQVIKDIYNYLAFLVNRRDDAALTGLLRSPFFSIPDSVIFEISHASGFTFWNKLRNSGKIPDAMRKIEENIMVSQRCDIPTLLRKILSETPFVSAVASRKNGSQELANVEKLIRVADDFSSRGFATLFDFVDFLSDTIKNDPKEPQAAVINDENAVKIMTLHQSKGLEFPVVFLFNSEDTTQDDKVRKKKITVNKEFGLITSVPGDTFFEKYQSAPINGLHNYIQLRKELAEDKRLLYVGVTRAANYLGISAGFERNKDGNFSFAERSFMGLIEQGMLKDKTFSDLFPSGTTEYFHTLRGSLEFLGGDVTSLEVTVPVFTVVEPVENPASENECTAPAFYNLGTVDDYYESEEIITASKFAAFVANPAAFYEKYVLGLKGDQNNGRYSGNKDGDEESQWLRELGSPKGTAIHAILSGGIKESELNTKLVCEIIETGTDFAYKDDENKKLQFASGIISEVKQYYASSAYKEISQHTDYKNEFEIFYYNEQFDYFMHGIIDKIIIDGNELTIVDYKTNDVKEKDLGRLSDYYMPQLMFYAVLAARMYPEKTSFRLQLVFTRFPEKKILYSCHRDDLAACEKQITDMILSLRKDEFQA
jgi:ATP-dependent helicase/nuclease subunit A